jgi:hypothetical protein
MSTIRAFIAAMNKDDAKTAAESFDSGQTAIIDEFAPHVWIGPTALSDWAAGADADAKAKGQTNATTALGAPIRVQVDGDTAYAVVPATFSYNQAGKKVHEAAVWTFALDRAADGWKIKAWAWGGHKPSTK